MLEFKQRQLETEELAPRWNIGVDRRHVAAYVGLALVAGFAGGFIADRYATRREMVPPPLVSESRPPVRQAANTQAVEFHRVTRIVRGDTIEVEGVGPVRMLGLETPDGKSPRELNSSHGQRALSYVEKTLLGQEVRVEADSTTARDKDERTS